LLILVQTDHICDEFQGGTVMKQRLRRRLLGAAAAMLLGFAMPMAAATAQAADALSLQLKWVTQGQFVGYYVALAKG
jgi:ABC-type nitrate/sulfonate/bicarbonate transport system substrate-binding protein